MQINLKKGEIDTHLFRCETFEEEAHAKEIFWLFFENSILSYTFSLTSHFYSLRLRNGLRILKKGQVKNFSAATVNQRVIYYRPKNCSNCTLFWFLQNTKVNGLKQTRSSYKRIPTPNLDQLEFCGFHNV